MQAQWDMVNTPPTHNVFKFEAVEWARENLTSATRRKSDMIEKFIFTVSPPMWISTMKLNMSEWLFCEVFEDKRITTAQNYGCSIVQKNCPHKAFEIKINCSTHIPGMQF